jgi:hypothetical protein
MTVQSNNPVVNYTGNGVTTSFNAPSNCISPPLVILTDNTIPASPVVWTLVLNSDYTLTSVGGLFVTVSLYVAPKNAVQVLSILLNEPFTQLTHWVEGDPFPAASHEAAADHAVLLAQQLAGQIQNLASPGLTAAQINAQLLAQLASTAAGQGDALVAGLRSETNAVPFTLDIYSQNRSYNAVVDGGMLTTNTAAQNTIALNNTIAANNAFHIPGGTYNLNALAPVTQSCQISLDANTFLNFTIPPTAAGAFVIGNAYAILAPGNTAWDGIGASVLAATAIIPGKSYVVKTNTTNQWTLCGASSNAPGTIFTATLPGTGADTAWEQNFVATGAGIGTGTAVGGAIIFNCGDTLSILRGGVIFVNTGGNTAAFAIQTQGNTRDFLIDRVTFGSSVVSYCIDAMAAYGLKAHDVTANTITGSGIRLRTNGGSIYNYATDIDHCDFTAYSGNGLEIDGTSIGPYNIRSSIFEDGISGIVCNTNALGGYIWNLHLDGCYIEANSFKAISLSNNGNSNNFTRCKMTGCYIQGDIDLGAMGFLIMESCTPAAINNILGSGSSQVTMFDCAQVGLSAYWRQKAGNTFAYLPQGYITGWNPALGAVGNTSSNGFYSINGRTVVAQAKVVISGAPSGNIQVPVPVLPLPGSLMAGLYGLNPIIGSAVARVAGTTFYLGAVQWYTTGGYAFIIGQGTTNNWQAAVPGAWASGDYVELSLNYQI